ncbi:MAG: hypothetical protein WBC06_04415 [Chitinophagaceae bacterium]
MNKKVHQSVRPLLIFFAVITVFIITGKGWLERNGVERNVLFVGNCILFCVSLAGFIITNNALNSVNTQAFLRALYGSFILKFFVVAVAAFIYFLTFRNNLNKPALLICAGLYIVYTAMEIYSLMKILKKKKNA